MTILKTILGPIRLLFTVIVFGMIFSTAEATQRRIVILETMPVPVITEGSAVFQETLKELLPAGDEVIFQVLAAEGDATIGARLLQKALADKRPDLVVAIATLGSKVVHQQLKGSPIPWVFFTVTDPVGAGIVERINAPSGTNLTGLVYGIDRRTKLEMAFKLIHKTTARRPIRIGFIHTDYPSSLGDRRMLEEAFAAHPGMQLVPYQLSYQSVPEKLPELLEQVRQATKELAGKVDYWWSPIGPLGERDEYTKLLIEETERPLLMATNMRGPELGALLYLGPDVRGQAREMAVMAQRILQGENAGNIPVTLPKSFAVGLNLDTAAKIGIVVPPDLLYVAGENVFLKDKN